MVRAGDYNFFCGKRNENHQLGTQFFVHHIIVSAVNRTECVSDTSYIDLRGCRGNIIVFNVHVPREEKSDDSKISFYEELEQVFNNLPKHHMKILLGDLENLSDSEDINRAWENIKGNTKISTKQSLGL